VALTWTRSSEWDSDDWRKVAECRDTDPDLFFPIGTTGQAIEQIDAAKAVCFSCEAREPCLEFALATNQESGVWAPLRKTSAESSARHGWPLSAVALADLPALQLARRLTGISRRTTVPPSVSILIVPPS